MIISEMQRKLATWAVTDPSLRIQRLLRLITQPEWLAEAARITLSSKGAHTPGVDGVNKTMLQARLAVELQILRDELLSGHYQPLPARRVYIPKSNGKLRPLGIPALRDRIVQRAMLMAMEPIWESDFHTLSYGFRPERSVHHAIRTVKLQLTDCGETRGRWVIEGDLSSYFDNYSESKVDMAEQLNRKLKGWAMFYQFVDFKAKVFSYIDRVVFWKLAHWLARKYRTGIASLMRWWCKSPKPGQSKTWVLFGKTNHGKLSGEILYRLVGQGKKLFRWRLPEGNPYLRTETRNTYTSRFTEVAMAFASI